MIADQTPFTAENKSVFCTNFKPFEANNGFKPSLNSNPFANEMSLQFSPSTNFSMNTEFKSFVPQNTNVS